MAKAQTKKSQIIKAVYQCQDCGAETESVYSVNSNSVTFPPDVCLECGLSDLKQTAKMEVSTTVVVIQLPFAAAAVKGKKK